MERDCSYRVDPALEAAKSEVLLRVWRERRRRRARMCPDCGQGGAQDAGVVVLLRAVEGDRGEQVDRAMAPFLMGRAHPVLTWV